MGITGINFPARMNRKAVMAGRGLGGPVPGASVAVPRAGRREPRAAPAPAPTSLGLVCRRRLLGRQIPALREQSLRARVSAAAGAAGRSPRSLRRPSTDGAARAVPAAPSLGSPIPAQGTRVLCQPQLPCPGQPGPGRETSSQLESHTCKKCNFSDRSAIILEICD